jgi:hypothetical protein
MTTSMVGPDAPIKPGAPQSSNVFLPKSGAQVRTTPAPVAAAVEAAKPQLPDSAPSIVAPAAAAEAPKAQAPKATGKEGAATTLEKGAKDIGGLASDALGVFGTMGDRIINGPKRMIEKQREAVPAPKPKPEKLAPPTLVKPGTPAPTPDPVTMRKRNRRMQKINGDT